MFQLNEKTIFRCGLFEGLKLNTRQQDRAINLCHFGPTRSPSLIVIAQTLDNILIYDLASFKNRLQHGQRSRDSDSEQQLRDSAVSHISIRDQVIESVSVMEVAGQNPLDSRDLLLIGCSKSMMIYDALNQEHLFSVNTLARIGTTLASASDKRDELTLRTRLLFCGGNQKLYTYQIHASSMNAEYDNRTSDALVDFELSSERTISETATCLIHGRFGQLECLIVGFEESRIKVFSVDSLEMSIQTCRLTLSKPSRINCICSIETVTQQGGDNGEHHPASRDASEDALPKQSALPSLNSPNRIPNLATNNHLIATAQMNYFAYGLESGLVGVYRLLETGEGLSEASDLDAELQKRQQQVSLFAERLWQHRAKQAPVSICLFDIDGDGMDELMVGYKNGRLEARSPFTGQLITSTRCFRSGQLAGLLRWTPSYAPADSMTSDDSHHSNDDMTMIKTRPKSEEHQVAILLACSTASSLVAFKPRQRQPRRPLIDYLQQRTRIHRGIEGDPMIDLDKLQSVATVKTQAGHDLEFADDDSAERSTTNNDGDHDDDDDDQLTGFPTTCESGQSSDLMQELALMKKQQVELKQRVGQLQREFLRRQVTTSQAALELMASHGLTPDQSGPKHMAHCWTLDGSNLLLTLVIEYLADQSVSVEMVELIDDSNRLLPASHLVIEPVSDVRQASGSLSIDIVMNNPTIHKVRERFKADAVEKNLIEGVHCIRIGVYLSESIAHKGAKTRGPTIRHCILERAISLPNFAMFVPETLVAVDSTPSDKINLNGFICKTFKLPERLNRLQILDWMHSNFLCFQFGQMVNHESQLAAGFHSVDELWSSALYNRLEAKRLDANMAQSMRQFSAIPSSSGGNADRAELSLHENNGDESFEFRFIDLGTIDDMRTSKRIGLIFRAKDRRLIVQSNEPDLLIDLIQQLVIDRLQLDLQADCVESTDEIEPLLGELKSIEENSKQLEESERRIETEIYESAELIKSLMQQLGIANELQMFSVSKELLSEISMLLDGTQNTAQAFYLNNRSRTSLVKQANCLREKISFLTGAQENDTCRDNTLFSSSASASGRRRQPLG